VGAGRPRPVVLDTGALIAFERNDRRVLRLVELAIAHGGTLHVPAGVVAQAWRDGRRQARLSKLIGSRCLAVRAFDLDEAKAAGALCGLRRTVDIVDASVVLLARRHGAAVVTSDPDDLRQLDSSVDLVRC
jgi:predicted nucleic acid-binding protein